MNDLYVFVMWLAGVALGAALTGMAVDAHYERKLCNNEPIEVQCKTTKTVKQP